MSASQPYPFLNPTYVFSDIEDSSVITRRLEKTEGIGVYETQLRDRYLRLVDEKFKENKGYLTQLVGDGHLIVFQYAKDALAFAVALQESLLPGTISRGTGADAATIRVRIGVHTTENQREPHRMGNDLALIDYPGSDTNFAARIMSLGDGGQIIVSAETCRQTNDLAGYRSHPWPNRFIKSFDDEPHTVHEILYYDGQIPREPGIRFFPDFYIGERNRYVDREAKEKQVFQQFSNKRADGSLKRNDGTTSRLVTIHAEGGMGKTRLAVACAVKMIGLFEGNAHFVNLAFVSAPKTLSETDEEAAARGITLREAVAEAIGKAMVPPIAPIASQGMSVTVFDALKARGDKRTLLILDNYESVQDDTVARYLSSLVTKTRGVHLLVTGRKMVGVDTVEQRVSLDDGMSESEARELFVARARLKEPEWEPSTTDEAHLSRILQLTSVVPEADEIKAIPLAVELAAAWVRYPLKKIADDLEKQPLGPMTEPIPGHVRPDDEETHERHRSLTRSFDWSYKLLGEIEGRDAQCAFASCGLFASSFDPETLAVVSGTDDAERKLLLLENASLVRPAHTDAGEVRYRLHRFTRAYASDKLAAAFDADAVRTRFVAHYVELVETNAATQMHMNRDECRAVFDNEWRNVIAAAEVAETTGNNNAVMSLSYVRAFFSLRALWSEWESLDKRALVAARAAGDQHGEGATLNNLGNVYESQGRWDEAIQAYEQARTIFHDLGDQHGEGATLNNLGNVYESQGRWDEAIQAYEQDLAICRALGDQHGEGQTLNNLGNVYQSQGRWDEAIQAYEQARTIFHDLGDQHGEGATLNNLGAVYRRQGRWDEAIQAYEQARTIFHDLGDQHGEGQTLNNLGNVYQSQGRWDEAIQAYEQARTIFHDLGDQHGEGATLNNLGAVYKSQGRWDEAIQAYEQSLKIKRALGDRHGEGVTLSNIALLHAKRGEFDTALPFARDAISLFEKTQDVAGLAQSRELLARIEAALPKL